MAYVSGYDSDVFISYCHRDDEAASGEGWVTQFHSHLRVALGTELESPPDIWRDGKLDPSNGLTKELERRIRGTTILLAIVSPAYIGSPWCEWELKGFSAADRRTGPLWIGTKCRAIKIVKTPSIDNAHRTRILPDVFGTDFFETDALTGRHFELPFSSEIQRRRVSTLAQDIRDILHDMRKGRTIFVGAASDALQEQQTKVKNELRAKDYRVLESDSAATPHEDLSQTIRGAIDKSFMSVHFIDRSAPQSIDVDLAAAIDLERRSAGQQGLKQVLVVRESETSARQVFADDAAATTGPNAEVLVNSPTAVIKDTVLEAAGRPLPVPAPRNLVRIYLVCDHVDHPLLDNANALALRDRLQGLGFEVKVPLADRSSDAEYGRDNRDKLKNCDAVLVYWGASRQRWFEQRLKELTAALGWRRRPFAANAAYLALPPESVKRNYATREVDDLIKAFEPDADRRLNSFVGRLAGAGHGP